MSTHNQLTITPVYIVTTSGRLIGGKPQFVYETKRVPADQPRYVHNGPVFVVK